MHAHWTDLCVPWMQRAPCAAHIPHDDPNFKTTEQEQEERLDFIAEYTDAMIRATLFRDQAATSFLLNEVTDSHLVRTAKVSCSCLVSPHDGDGVDTFQTAHEGISNS